MRIVPTKNIPQNLVNEFIIEHENFVDKQDKVEQ